MMKIKFVGATIALTILLYIQAGATMPVGAFPVALTTGGLILIGSIAGLLMEKISR